MPLSTALPERGAAASASITPRTDAATRPGIILFAVDLGWLPAQGMTSLRASATGWGHVRDVAWHLVLPAFSITIFFVAVVARVARASIVGVLSEDYVTTAMAKGLSRRAILWRHVLPNAMIPVVTVIGYSFGYSLTGAIQIGRAHV